MKFHVCYGTGAGDFETEGTLEEAKVAADKGAAYTQQDIRITDEDGNEVSRRRWCGVQYDPDAVEDTEDEVIQFGSFGHYAAWIDM